MNSEELKRAIEFLVEQQIHLIARFDAFVERFDGFVGRFEKFLQKSDRQHESVAVAIDKLAAVVEIQSLRLDRHDEFLRESRAWQQTHEDEAKVRHDEVIARLDQIIGRLSDRKN